ncbi:MAG TPA: hypothetical protein P5307_07510 [Pirellulaceae bacterium]|nr:hypothetical protein [Planctomycetales bacterium]MCB9941099.1 hypothetical protein [Planctomycetaceae bacterium]HRX78893.1 hypothetical protein [Pirellulaceae bacterium]
MLRRTSLLIAFTCLNGLVLERITIAQEFAAATISLVSATSVSDSFQRETQKATKSVPPQVWKTLDDAGWRVQLAEFVVDAAPSLRGVRPAGWPRHLTWDNSDAIHLPTSKLLVVAEKRRNRSGDVVASTRVAGVLRHEIGHAFDMASGGSGRLLSTAPSFIQAYQQDVSRIAAGNRTAFAYYLQDGRNGLQETFAEAFAVALGGGSSNIEPAEFESSFPRVMAYTRRAIAEPTDNTSVATPTRTATGVTYRRRFVRRR